MKRFMILAALLVGALAGVVFLAVLMMTMGVNPAQLHERLEPVMDAFRLAHIALWALLWMRWTRLVDWLIARQYVQGIDRDTLIALRGRVMAVFAVWIILVVIGVSRIATLLGLGQ